MVGRDDLLKSAIEHLKMPLRDRKLEEWQKTIKTIFVEGIEGSGKTRFCQALISEAGKLGYQCYVERADNPSPVKRLMRQMLGLAPSETRKIAVENALENQTMGYDNSHWENLCDYLTDRAPTSNPDYLDLLKTEAVLLFRNIAEKQQLFIVIENVQWTAEGDEQELLAHLITSLLPADDHIVMFCMTYRPQETATGRPIFLEQVKVLRSDRFELLKLTPLARTDVRTLADALIPFPRLSDSLIDFVLDRSEGRPLYILELLRVLVSRGALYLKLRTMNGILKSRSLWTMKSRERALIIQRRVEDLSLPSQQLIKVLSVAGSCPGN